MQPYRQLASVFVVGTLAREYTRQAGLEQHGRHLLGLYSGSGFKGKVKKRLHIGYTLKEPQPSGECASFGCSVTC